MNLDEHNRRVRALAERMPVDTLARAICAIGYRADFETGITSGFSVATMARLSRKNLGGSYSISARQLNRAISVLKSAQVIRVVHSPPKAGKRQTNLYHFDYGYSDITRLTEAYEGGKRQRRLDREASRYVGSDEWLEDAIASLPSRTCGCFYCRNDQPESCYFAESKPVVEDPWA